jgi:hypothetical protein
MLHQERCRHHCPHLRAACLLRLPPRKRGHAWPPQPYSLPIAAYKAQNISDAVIDFILEIPWLNVTNDDHVKQFLPGGTPLDFTVDWTAQASRHPDTELPAMTEDFMDKWRYKLLTPDQIPLSLASEERSSMLILDVAQGWCRTVERFITLLTRSQ